MTRKSGWTAMQRIRRTPFCALLLAGVALASAPAAAEVVHHPVAHPHPVFHPHPVVHRPIHAVVHRGPVRGVAHFARPGFHPLHAAIMGHVSFAHFTPAERAVWIRGNWHHAWYHGRYGWWWFAGGAWFWYAAPVYPYPTMVSDYYYEEPAYSQAGPPWYYCYSPPGYYPYVPTCYGPWRPIPPQGYGAEGVAPEQGSPPGYDQGPPPGYNQGPPPGYDQAGPPGAGQGPPPDYDQEPPPGYEQGPPPGYDQGPPPGDYQSPGNQQGPQ
jgi:hypothetical protein